MLLAAWMPKETEKLDGLALPFLRGILPINTNRLASDILAGVTLAALGIPEGLHKNIWNTDRNGTLHLTASGYRLCPARGLSPPGRLC